MPRLTVQKAKALRTTFEFDVRPGVSVLMRKLDVLGQIFAGQMPSGMVAAIRNMEQVWDQASEQKINPFDLFASMPKEERDAIFDMLRDYAAAAIVDPPMVNDLEGTDTHASVYIFDIVELVRIYNAVPPANVEPSSPEQPPQMTTPQVRSFRPAPQTGNVGAVPDRETLPPAAESVDYEGVDEIKAG